MSSTRELHTVVVGNNQEVRKRVGKGEKGHSKVAMSFQVGDEQVRPREAGTIREFPAREELKR